MISFGPDLLYPQKKLSLIIQLYTKSRLNLTDVFAESVRYLQGKEEVPICRRKHLDTGMRGTRRAATTENRSFKNSTHVLSLRTRDRFSSRTHKTSCANRRLLQ
ncbi:hypothetical protein Bca4012_090201 [Brassica carinata]